MDLISELPEALLHRMLYFLPIKDVVRTSCLSKTWRSIRSSYTTVNFIQRYFDPPNDFREFMKNSLQSFTTQKSGVQRFKLCMTSSDDPELNYLIDQWINYVAKSRVEEVAIHIEKSTSGVLPLSSKVPAAGILLASKTLITLSLYRCELEKSSIISLPHLQKLVMVDVDLDETLAQNLILGCPLLEDLKLEHCNKLTRLQVSNLKSIKKIGVRYCPHLRRVEVRAPSLETLAITGASEEGIISAYEIDLAGCETTLKDLTLSFMKLTGGWVQDYISKFVCLESLFLIGIPNLETIKLSSPKLKQLSISKCLELGAATEIDAPLLYELVYDFNKLPFYNISTSNLEEVDLYFTLGDHDDFWFNTLKDFFRKTSHIQNFKVAVTLNNEERGRVITHELTDSVFLLWEQLRHLNLNLDVLISSNRPAYWISDLFDMSRLDKMYIAGYGNSSSDLLRAFEKELSNMNMQAAADRAAFAKNGNCANKKCTPSSRLRVVEVRRTNLAQANEQEEEDEDVITRWIPLLNAYQTLYDNITCVDLKWVREPFFRCRGGLNCTE